MGIESSILSIGTRVTALERSRMDDTIQFQMLQRFGENTPIPASVIRSVMFSPSPASVITTTAAAPIAQPVLLVASSSTTIELQRVPIAKYIKLTQSSVDIADKYFVVGTLRNSMIVDEDATNGTGCAIGAAAVVVSLMQMMVKTSLIVLRWQVLGCSPQISAAFEIESYHLQRSLQHPSENARVP